MSESLPPDLVHALVAAEPRLAGFVSLHYFGEADSTNDIALSLAQAGAPEGTAVLADLQRAGRGRHGRSWFSPPGAGLYLSVVVRCADLASPISLLTLASGVAVAEAVASTTGLPVELKWPNDVVIGRPWRKLAGVLCESTGVGGRVDAVVVGIGVNLRAAAYPPELGDRATSIEVELGRSIDRAPIVVECLAQLTDAVNQLREGRHDWILNQWRRFGRAGLDGASVRWQEHGVERLGLARDIDTDGALFVETGGRLERLIGGEVSWERLSHG
jgi:BirA family transcriptional regulator, biotin operon repressor / biotin---[acetyl-CoA-carboxylase] ligase